MRAASVVSEAWRDLLTGTARAATLALVLVLGVGSLAVLDARAMVGVLRDAEEFRAAGAATWVLDDLDNVDGSRCAALDGVGGMRAGALRQGGPLRALAMPSSQLTVWEATPGLLGAALGRDVTTATGVWLSEDLASALGARPGSVLATTAGETPVAGVYAWPDDGRARTLGYSVVVPVAPTGRFSACWASTWPPDRDTAGLLYSTTGAKVGAQATFGQLNGRLGAELDAPALLEARLTRWAPAAATLLGLVVGWAGVRMRRLHVASALHARVPRPHLAWQHLLEAGAWVCAAVLVAAAATGWAAAAGNPEPPTTVWLTALRTVGAGAGAALLGTLAGVLGTRERHLFRYFKDR